MRFSREFRKGKLKCPYKGCGKEFDQPTVIIDSSKILREIHYICPHCTTKIEIVTENTKLIGVIAAEHPIVFDSPAKTACESSQIDESNEAEITSNKKTELTSSDCEIPRGGELGDGRQETLKEQREELPGFHCSYHFGYLAEKDKNEVVPETCFGCPKSLNCMLSQFNRSQESLEEIKKWYSF
jgi:hypothetical protein